MYPKKRPRRGARAEAVCVRTPVGSSEGRPDQPRFLHSYWRSLFHHRDSNAGLISIVADNRSHAIGDRCPDTLATHLAPHLRAASTARQVWATFEHRSKQPHLQANATQRYEPSRETLAAFACSWRPTGAECSQNRPRAPIFAACLRRLISVSPSGPSSSRTDPDWLHEIKHGKTRCPAVRLLLSPCCSGALISAGSKLPQPPPEPGPSASDSLMKMRKTLQSDRKPPTLEPLSIRSSLQNERYLNAKKHREGHAVRPRYRHDFIQEQARPCPAGGEWFSMVEVIDKISGYGAPVGPAAKSHLEARRRTAASRSAWCRG
jgi:hypothetical protein